MKHVHVSTMALRIYGIYQRRKLMVKKTHLNQIHSRYNVFDLANYFCLGCRVYYFQLYLELGLLRGLFLLHRGRGRRCRRGLNRRRRDGDISNVEARLYTYQIKQWWHDVSRRQFRNLELKLMADQARLADLEQGDKISGLHQRQCRNLVDNGDNFGIAG